MTEPFARIAGMAEGPQSERRRYPRQPAWAMAQLRSGQGEACEAVLTDVTAHGCSLRCDADWLRAGAFVSLGLEDDPPLTAIIRWVRDDCAGLEFLRAVSAEHIGWRALLDQPYGI